MAREAGIYTQQTRLEAGHADFRYFSLIIGNLQLDRAPIVETDSFQRSSRWHSLSLELFSIIVIDTIYILIIHSNVSLSSQRIISWSVIVIEFSTLALLFLLMGIYIHFCLTFCFFFHFHFIFYFILVDTMTRYDHSGIISVGWNKRLALLSSIGGRKWISLAGETSLLFCCCAG